jgi:hypothetical protein
MVLGDIPSHPPLINSKRVIERGASHGRTPRGPKAHEAHAPHQDHVKEPHDLNEIDPKMTSDIALDLTGKKADRGDCTRGRSIAGYDPEWEDNYGIGLKSAGRAPDARWQAAPAPGGSRLRFIKNVR